MRPSIVAGRAALLTQGSQVVPYLNLQITPGATRRQKQLLVRQFTRLLGRVLGKLPEHIHVVIQDIPEENWGYRGMLTDEFRAAAAQTDNSRKR